MNDQVKLALANVAKTAGSATAGNKSAFAEMITEVVNPNHLSFEILNTFLDTRILQPGDSLVKRVRSNLPVRTFVPGTMHLADQVFTRDVMTYSIDYVIAKIIYHQWELQRGEVETIENLRRDMQSALIDSFVSRAFTLLTTVWNAYSNAVTGSHYTVAGAGLTEAVLTAGMEKVLTHAGSIRAIVGTRSALLPVYQNIGIVDHLFQGGTAENTVGIQSFLDEWKRTGRISVYKGAPLVELPQIYSRSAGGYDEKLMPDNYVLIIGDNAGEFILYGDTQTQEYVDLRVEPPDYSLSMWRGYGMLVEKPENIAVIEVPAPTYAAW